MRSKMECSVTKMLRVFAVSYETPEQWRSQAKRSKLRFRANRPAAPSPN